MSSPPTSGRPASPRVSCAFCSAAAGLTVEHIWSVTPGAYGRDDSAHTWSYPST